MKALIAVAAALALVGTAAAQPVGHAAPIGVGLEANLGLAGSSHSNFGITIGFKGHHHGVTYGKQWAPGHFESRVEHYTVAARTQRVWCDPVYAYHADACGHLIKVLVSGGHFAVVVIEPERVECRSVRVWVPGCWR